MKNLAEMFPDEAIKAFANLKEARMSQRAAEVQRSAHNLKGIFGMFEIPDATAAAFDLEKTATAGGLGTDLQMNTLSDELDRAVQAVKDFQKTLNQ
ncbi:MAG: Hpt domain-containing protein [Acidobacteriia bacterium]|nr:Hpt domain-containing protein [Terriglobia bacterium]